MVRCACEGLCGSPVPVFCGLSEQNYNAAAADINKMSQKYDGNDCLAFVSPAVCDTVKSWLQALP